MGLLSHLVVQCAVVLVVTSDPYETTHTVFQTLPVTHTLYQTIPILVTVTESYTQIRTQTATQTIMVTTTLERPPNHSPIGVRPSSTQASTVATIKGASFDSTSPTSSLGCTLNGKQYKSGTFTSSDRCIRYRCINGAWKYHSETINCGQCQSSAKKVHHTSIKTYDVHLLGGTSTPSYQFIGSNGTYTLSQKYRSTPPETVVNAIFTHNAAGESRITNVIYKEKGITVEFKYGPHKNVEILVNNSTVNPYNSMEPFNSTVGTVYIYHDSHSRVQIVGSQGLTVSIWAAQDYAWYVNTYAKATLANNLFGLCDQYTTTATTESAENDDPIRYYTMKNTHQTDGTRTFIESWKL